MKKLSWIVLSLAVFAMITSCSSVDVVSDYDNRANFNSYKSYAFYKTGIDRAQISDLDKRRILRAVEYEMSQRGFQKSRNPDILVNIFTTERERVQVYNYGWGWGGWGWGGWYGPYWGPYWGGYWGGPYVSSYTEGALFIDLIDTKTKQLVWQGKGVGTLSSYKNIEKKERRIQQFVYEIMQEYPPVALVAN